MKKIHKHWSILLVLVVALTTALPLFHSGYFSHHDDLQVMRIFEMRRCFEDGQIPCRWVPDMGYGNGFPLFNYYGVLPYYIGALASYLIGYIGAAKLLFFIPIILGGVAIYLLGKELFGKLPGAVSSILFILAPYRALDLYVRGDVTESWALSLAPLLFWLCLRLVRKRSLLNFSWLSICFGAFLITHNIMTMFFLPILIVWLAYLEFKNQFKRWWEPILSLGLGFGLSAFFLLPSFFEKNLVQINNLITADLNFRAHFVTINQLFFDRFWGYGASVIGPNDTISFQLGWPHWWLVGGAVLILIWKLFKRFKLREVFVPIFLTIIFGVGVLMSHNQSSFIWEKIDLLKFAQFPWRFLSLTIFGSSLLGGFVLSVVKPRYQLWGLILITTLTFGLNFSYFKPQTYVEVTDAQKLSGQLWVDQQKASLTDYLPLGVPKPLEAAPNVPTVKLGQPSVTNFINKSNRWSFEVKATTPTVIEVPVFDFPNWQVKVNGQSYDYSSDNYLHRVTLSLPAGQFNIMAKFTNTLIRTLANGLTLLSLLALVLFIVYARNKKIFK